MTELEEKGFQIVQVNNEIQIHLYHFDEWEKAEEIRKGDNVIDVLTSEEVQIDFIITRDLNKNESL